MISSDFYSFFETPKGQYFVTEKCHELNCSSCLPMLRQLPFPTPTCGGNKKSVGDTGHTSTAAQVEVMWCP